MVTLVTGGTGFIGAEIVRRLLAEDPDADIHVAYHSGNFQRLADLTERISLHPLDLADTKGIHGLVAAVAPDVIYHFGAVLTGPGEANPQMAIETNAIGTYALLEAARIAGTRQVVFASSIGTYGSGIPTRVIDDATLQRPLTVYGVTKVFGENLGAFYKRRYGLDFRGIRYPSIVGPGVKTPSVVQYTSWVIEESAKGNPFTITVTPEFAVPIMYFKDAARAAITLSRAPLDAIASGTYLVDGHRPSPTAAELADVVRARLPDAEITFEPDPVMQPILDEAIRPLDDSRAREEWGWAPAYDLDAIVADFLEELETNPDRYR